MQSPIQGGMNQIPQQPLIPGIVILSILNFSIILKKLLISSGDYLRYF